jgi:hypothetical protein
MVFDKYVEIEQENKDLKGQIQLLDSYLKYTIPLLELKTNNLSRCMTENT